MFWYLIVYQILIGESSAPAGSDPIAMMEYYMKKAAQEEKLRPPKHSKDEMPPPASLQGIIDMSEAISLSPSPTYIKSKREKPRKLICIFVMFCL